MKIHCAQLVEGALRSALAPGQAAPVSSATPNSPTLFDQLGVGAEKQVKVVLHKKSD
jgi:hypothetical protein